MQQMQKLREAGPGDVGMLRHVASIFWRDPVFFVIQKHSKMVEILEVCKTHVVCFFVCVCAIMLLNRFCRYYSFCGI